MSESKPERTKLTRLEEAYVNELTRIDDDRPMTLTEAFLRVNVNARKWARQAQNNEASVMYRRPIVQRAIQARQAMIDAERRRTSRSSRAMIETALWKEAKGADRASDRINALKAIAAMLPPDQDDSSAADEAASRQELVAELEALLSASLGQAIDVTPEITSGEEDQVEPEESDDSTGDEDSSDVLDVDATITESWDDPTPEEPAF